MQTKRNPKTTGGTRRGAPVGLLVLVGVLGTWLVVGSALAAPRPPAPPAPTTTTTSTVADTTPPPPPDLTQKPDDPTTNQNAHFKISSAEGDVTFECDLDGLGWEPCAQTVNYNNLDFAEHCIDARAVDAAGNPSTVTTWCWSVVIQGGFPISGTVDDPFFPGATRPLNLVIGNPYNFTIRVTSVAITVADTTSPPDSGCAGPANLTVTQDLAVAVDVPRNSTHSLLELGVHQDDWPQLTMPNLPVNQDACKNVTFSLTFVGQATKP